MAGLKFDLDVQHEDTGYSLKLFVSSCKTILLSTLKTAIRRVVGGDFPFGLSPSSSIFFVPEYSLMPYGWQFTFLDGMKEEIVLMLQQETAPLLSQTCRKQKSQYLRSVGTMP